MFDFLNYNTHILCLFLSQGATVPRPAYGGQKGAGGPRPTNNMTPTSAGSTAYRPAPAAGQQQQQSWGGGGGGGAAYAQAASMRFAAPISVSAPTTYTAPAYQQHNSVSTATQSEFNSSNVYRRNLHFSSQI